MGEAGIGRKRFVVDRFGLNTSVRRGGEDRGLNNAGVFGKLSSSGSDPESESESVSLKYDVPSEGIRTVTRGNVGLVPKFLDKGLRTVVTGDLIGVLGEAVGDAERVGALLGDKSCIEEERLLGEPLTICVTPVSGEDDVERLLA